MVENTNNPYRYNHPENVGANISDLNISDDNKNKGKGKCTDNFYEKD